MGSLERLPIHVLSIVHGLAIETGSLPDALALETASKTLSTLCRLNIPFPDQLGVLWSYTRLADPARLAAFQMFAAAHGHRLPYLLALEGISLGDGDGPLPSLHNQEGPTRAGAVAIQSSTMAMLQPLAGLSSLTYLRSDGSTESSSLGALQQRFAALMQLERGSAADDSGFMLMASLEPLASFTSLTKLHVLSLPDVTSLEFLTCLRASLKSLQVQQPSSGPEGATTMEPITCLTSLTSLCLGDFHHLQTGLAPLSALQDLQRLALWSVASQPSEALDLQPLTQLASLKSLQLWFCTITNLQPIAALGSTLQKLDLCGNLPALELSVAAALTELTFLELCAEATSLDFLGPLTRLMWLRVNCSNAVEGLEPVGVLTALRRLHVGSGSMISSLAPLSSLGALASLDLCSLGRVSSLQPLSGLTALEYLSLDTCPCISDQDLELLLTALPGLRPGMLQISGCPLIARSEP
jgi:hypothetical protein